MWQSIVNTRSFLGNMANKPNLSPNTFMQASFHTYGKTRLISIESQPKKIMVVVVIGVVVVVVHVVVVVIPVVDPRNILLNFG